jgi:FdhE protein
MKHSWDQRIARAQELSQQHVSAAELLGFYARIAEFQKYFYDGLQRTNLPASVEVITPRMPGLLKLVILHGPPALAESANTCLNNESRWREILTTGDTSESDPADVFFARALLQPYTEHLAGRADIALNGAKRACPFCAEKPVVAVLRGEGDGAKRTLVCSLCSTEWDFRRLLCPGCGEENKDKLPVYTASDLNYVRVEACESCRTYIKAIDLTKNGLAVPVVDELASVALDVWAEEEGYTKLMPNLLAL